MSAPIAFKLSRPNYNDVIILTADMTLEAVQRTAYEAILGRSLGRMDDDNQSFPATTAITESNVAAVIQLLELRRGVDVLRGSLPKASE
ncbi:hypothetical protein VE02_09089 [Pseudogymnoascus sp. 03VT05]|nr:hypothetical protein VE02_09089 [Pseudogymnoascus sp. 03VT05]